MTGRDRETPGMHRPAPGIRFRWVLWHPEKGFLAGQQLFETVDEAYAWLNSREDLKYDRRLSLQVVITGGEDTRDT